MHARNAARRRPWRFRHCSCPALPVAAQETAPSRTGHEVYETVCITCHGPDGRGGVNPALEKIVKPPDFTDCAFAAREPDRGFLAVAHNGGPARGFSPLMAPWGGAYTEEELRLAVWHLRTFCTDQRWPRGELNLPRPFVTAKAFPEDEMVVSTAGQSGQRHHEGLLRAEVRATEHGGGHPAGVLGGKRDERPIDQYRDIALEYKRTLAHSLNRGNILSVTGEFVLPTGSEDRGLGGLSGVRAVRHLRSDAAARQLRPGAGRLRDSDGERPRQRIFWRAAVGKLRAAPLWPDGHRCWKCWQRGRLSAMGRLRGMFSPGCR